MTHFLHDNDYDNADAKATAIPRLFPENRRAKKQKTNFSLDQIKSNCRQQNKCNSHDSSS